MNLESLRQRQKTIRISFQEILGEDLYVELRGPTSFEFYDLQQKILEGKRASQVVAESENSQAAKEKIKKNPSAMIDSTIIIANWIRDNFLAVMVGNNFEGGDRIEELRDAILNDLDLMEKVISNYFPFVNTLKRTK